MLQLLPSMVEALSLIPSMIQRIKVNVAGDLEHSSLKGRGVENQQGTDPARKFEPNLKLISKQSPGSS